MLQCIIFYLIIKKKEPILLFFLNFFFNICIFKKVSCTDARNYVFIAREDDNMQCKDHRDNASISQTSNMKSTDDVKKQANSVNSSGTSVRDIGDGDNDVSKSNKNDVSDVSSGNDKTDDVMEALVESKVLWIQTSIHWLAEEDNFASNQCLWNLKDIVEKIPSSTSSSNIKPSSSLSQANSLVNENEKCLQKENILKQIRSKCGADYNVDKELARLGIINQSGEVLGLGKRWRRSQINESYTLCSTYPRDLVFPYQLSTDILKEQILKDDPFSTFIKRSQSNLHKNTNKINDEIESMKEDDNKVNNNSIKVSMQENEKNIKNTKSRLNDEITSINDDIVVMNDDFLEKSAPWRSMKRLPVLTWLNKRSGAPIMRSSQPMVLTLHTTHETSTIFFSIFFFFLLIFQVFFF